ncbi:MAG: hypothetical protein OEZ22_13020 [Spirochaetia bacterium]|nr:hypothetical protein [Spirochaetia bacterium]
MKSLVNKKKENNKKEVKGIKTKAEEKKQKPAAQCCAKMSKITSGCHD